MNALGSLKIMVLLKKLLACLFLGGVLGGYVSYPVVVGY